MKLRDKFFKECTDDGSLKKVNMVPSGVYDWFMSNLSPYLNHKTTCELYDNGVDLYLKEVEGYERKCDCGFNELL